jgi:hypothetical protein
MSREMEREMRRKISQKGGSESPPIIIRSLW